MHLALVVGKGTIWDISLNEHTSPSRKELITLPGSIQYFGYSDDKGSLYILDGELKKKVQMINFNVISKTISTSPINSNYSSIFNEENFFFFKKGVRFGKHFWLFRKLHCKKLNSSAFQLVS